MAHSAVDKKQNKYGTLNYVIRAKLFKGLKDGSMNMRSIFDDEKMKLQSGQICNYCGSTKYLTLDHVLPKALGGSDSADNLLFVCKTCNSSKGKKDLMEWMVLRGRFLPLFVIRRYLKLVYQFCKIHGLLELKIEELKDMNLPFNIEFMLLTYPDPDQLCLSVDEKIEVIE